MKIVVWLLISLISSIATFHLIKGIIVAIAMLLLPPLPHIPAFKLPLPLSVYTITSMILLIISSRVVVLILVQN